MVAVAIAVAGGVATLLAALALTVHHPGWVLINAGFVGPPLAIPVLAHLPRRRPHRASALTTRPPDRARAPAAPRPSRWCHCRVLFVSFGGTSLVIDGLVTACDEPGVWSGTPISVRFAVPPAQVLNVRSFRAGLGQETTLVIEVLRHSTGRDARLANAGHTVTLPMDGSAGWPSEDRHAGAA